MVNLACLSIQLAWDSKAKGRDRDRDRQTEREREGEKELHILRLVYYSFVVIVSKSDLSKWIVSR